MLEIQKYFQMKQYDFCDLFQNNQNWVGKGIVWKMTGHDFNIVNNR